MSVAALALVVFLLIQLYVVVVPVLLALFIAAVLEPAVTWLRARRLPSGLAAAVVFLGSLAALVLTLLWVGVGVAGQLDDVGKQVEEAIASARTWAQGEPLSLSPQKVNEVEADIRETVRTAQGGLAERAVGRARIAGEALGGVVLLLFTLFFLLKDGARMADWLRGRIPDAYREDAVAIAGRGRDVMRQYLIATAATGAIDGLLIGIALWILGVPLVVPLATLTFLGGFIPLVGATVAGLASAMVALVTNGLGVAALVVAATLLVQQIEGNLLQPLILERAVRLHPLVTVWAVAGGLAIGGLLGAFLAVPLTAMAVGVGSHYSLKNQEPAPAPDEAPTGEDESPAPDEAPTGEDESPAPAEAPTGGDGSPAS